MSLRCLVPLSVLLTTLLASGCPPSKGAEREDETTDQQRDPPVVGLLILEQGSVPPYGLLRARPESGEPLQETLRARVGGQGAPVFNDGSGKLSIMVPALPAGIHDVQVYTPTRLLTAPVQVLAAPEERNPGATLDAVTAAVLEPLDALLANPELSAEERAEIQGQRTRMVDLRAEFNSLTPAEQADVAACLRANAGALAIPGMGAPVPPPVLKDGSCVIDGQHHTTYEECRQHLGDFLRSTVVGAVSLAVGISAVTFLAFNLTPDVLLTAGGRLLVAGVSAVSVYVWLRNKHSSALEAFLTPVLGDLVEAGHKSRDQLARNEFLVGQAKPYEVTGRYRSLSRQEMGGTGGTLVSLAQDMEDKLNALRSHLRLEPWPPLLPQAPSTQRTNAMPSAYLALGTVTPGTITGTATAQPDWELRFDWTAGDAPPETPFTFTVRYQPPELPTQERTESGLLFGPVVDAGMPDAGTPDAGVDAGPEPVDAGTDAGVPDAGIPDAARPDAAPRLCGNGQLDPGEQCDGNQFGYPEGYNLCFDYVRLGGTMGCAAECTLDLSGCGPSACPGECVGGNGPGLSHMLNYGCDCSNCDPATQACMDSRCPAGCTGVGGMIRKADLWEFERICVCDREQVAVALPTCSTCNGTTIYFRQNFYGYQPGVLTEAWWDCNSGRNENRCGPATKYQPDGQLSASYVCVNNVCE